MGKLIFAIAAFAPLAFAAPVYAGPDCTTCIVVADCNSSACVVADGGSCNNCVIADGGGCSSCIVADCSGAGCVIADSGGCSQCVVADGNNCTNCVVADSGGGCSTCIIADGSGKGGNATGFVACIAEDNRGHCVESASYQCAPYSEACRLPRKPRPGKIAEGSCTSC